MYRPPCSRDLEAGHTEIGAQRDDPQHDAGHRHEEGDRRPAIRGRALALTPGLRCLELSKSMPSPDGITASAAASAPGDPARMATRIIESGTRTVPLRLVLGSQALQSTIDTLKRR